MKGDTSCRILLDVSSNVFLNACKNEQSGIKSFKLGYRYETTKFGQRGGGNIDSLLLHVIIHVSVLKTALGSGQTCFLNGQ
jgi:hypothetical protein